MTPYPTRPDASDGWGIFPPYPNMEPVMKHLTRKHSGDVVLYYPALDVGEATTERVKVTVGYRRDWKPRGVHLVVQSAVTVEPTTTPGCSIEKYPLYHDQNLRTCVHPMARRTDRVIEQVQEAYDEVAQRIAQRVWEGIPVAQVFKEELPQPVTV